MRGEFLEPPALEPDEGDRRHATAVGIFAGLHHVGRIPRRADEEDRVLLGQVVLQRLREDGVVGDVVPDRGQHRHVRGERDRAEGWMPVHMRSLRAVADGVIGDRGAAAIPGDPDDAAIGDDTVEDGQHVAHRALVEVEERAGEAVVVGGDEGVEVDGHGKGLPGAGGRSSSPGYGSGCQRGGPRVAGFRQRGCRRGAIRASLADCPRIVALALPRFRQAP